MGTSQIGAQPQLVRENNYNTECDCITDFSIVIMVKDKYCVDQHCFCSWMLLPLWAHGSTYLWSLLPPLL